MAPATDGKSANGDAEAEQFLMADKKGGLQDTVSQAAWAEKKWVWLTHKEEGYLAATIVSENGDKVTIAMSDGNQQTVPATQVEKQNPPKYDKVEDMAELSYLNEASVLHNLKQRYFSSLIYTYSGLFLVTVNPYRRLPIYSDKVVFMYRNRRKGELPPHIYAIAEASYHDMVTDRENQSILITGESGAGKTENTKKVIQYLTSVASESKNSVRDLEKQILQANPILEAFGNAQTIRNNNSSRFGKFIRIEFTGTGIIASGNIERYLLEKSRVTSQTAKERNYHIFYQIIKGAPADMKKEILLDNVNLNEFEFTKKGNKNIDGVDDAAEWNSVIEAMNVMKWEPSEQLDFFRCIASILYMGNITTTADREDQALMTEVGQQMSEKACHLLGISVAEFSKGLLKPLMKAGREIVAQSRSPAQVTSSLEALARGIYERMFYRLVERVNQSIDTPSARSTFIGVLDIAGFEIFEVNSFEQLCINYTNERLQQFFNHHMFILEQEEYKKEGIEWKFIDFGMDLQTTIDLIEKATPIGILSCLDEDCVMPKASDKSFTEKLIGLWKGKTNKFEIPRLGQGEAFILHHYAAPVEYKTAGWLEKNKDPLNDNITKLLAHSSDKMMAQLFADSSGEDDGAARRVGTVKKGAFRTVAQKHKEQLSSLMNQLYSTQPHFVRCIIPNEKKQPGKVDANLVLDQLRCNGVLEGIRICRQGFPSRLPFSEFRQRYEILCVGAIAKGFMDGRKACQIIIEKLALDANQFRMGSSKVFFRAGVLADLEERRDNLLSGIVTNFQAHSRGFLIRRVFKKKLDQMRAVRIIQRNARIFVQLREWSWWRLYSKVKPLLNVSRVDDEMRRREETIKSLEEKTKGEEEEKSRLNAEVKTLGDERKRLEEQLNSERSVAADQAEILARTQKRTVDLEENLKALTEDYDKIEAQADDLKRVRAKAEDKLNEITAELEQSRMVQDKLEKDKQAKDQQLAALQSEVNNLQSSSQRLTDEKKRLEGQVQNFNRELETGQDKENELVKVKKRLEAQISELEDRVSSEESAKADLQRKKNAVEAELRNTKESLSEAQRLKAELENNLKRKDQELRDAQEQLSNEGSDKQNLDRRSRELASKLASAEAENDAIRSERDKAVKAKKKLEEEMEEMQQMVEAQGDDSSKQTEARRLREMELADAKRQMDQLQQDYDDHRKKSLQQIEQLRNESEKSKSDLAVANKNKSALEGQIKTISEDLERAEEGKVKLEKQRRHLDSELQQLKAKSMEDAQTLGDTKFAKENSDRQIQTMQSRIDEIETSLSKAERDKSTAERQLASANSELDEANRKVSSLDSARKKQNEQIAELQERLDESENLNIELARQVATKNNELESLRANPSEGGGSVNTAEVERLKSKYTHEIQDLNERIDELDRQLQTSEKNRMRFSNEADDLRVELEREHAALRASERTNKQQDSEIKNLNSAIEGERRQRESLEAAQRRLQSSLDSANITIEEKTQQCSSLQRSKEVLENELKSIADETGGSGKNVHELEKTKRRLEGRIEELEALLEEEDAGRKMAEDAKRRTEEQMSEYRQRMEKEIVAKDQQMEDTRKMLLKEVNAMGEQLDEEQAAKNELLRQKKRLEQEHAELISSSDRDSKNKGETEKARKRTEQQLREATQKLEDERKARLNYEELASRHEKKSHQLQSDMERMEQQLEQSERARRQFEKRANELQLEVDGGEGSKHALVESKKNLEAEVARLNEALEDSERQIGELKTKAETAGSGNNAEFEALKAQAQNDADEKISKLEESRRALMSAQRVTEQELDERKAELSSIDKQKKLLQAEVEDLQARLEQETNSKNEEASGRRKATTELRELQLQLETAVTRSTDMDDTLSMYKGKYEEAVTKYEAAEIARNKAEKSETSLRVQHKEMEDSLGEALKERLEAEQRAKALEAQLLDVHDRTEEETMELNELRGVRERLQSELNDERDRYRRQYDERENEIETVRRRFQREIKELQDDLEHEKSTGGNAKDKERDLNSKIDELSMRLEEESRALLSARKDKERMETRLNDLNRAHDESIASHEGLQSKATSLISQVRDLRSTLEETENQKSILERAKRTMEVQLEELNEQFNEVNKQKLILEKNAITLESAQREIKGQLEDANEQSHLEGEKARRAEAAVSEANSETMRQRENVVDLERQKLSLEKQLKEVQLRVVDLETVVGNTDSSKGTRALETKIMDLNAKLEKVNREKDEVTQTQRRGERLIRDLQNQLAEKEKLRQRQEDDFSRTNDKLRRMKQEMLEVETRDSELGLSKRRVERELDEFKDKAMRLEREVEKLRTSRRPESTGNF